MKFLLNRSLELQLKEAKLKNPKLFKKIQKQLKLFLEDHKHPSLRLHKLKGILSEKWSISIEKDMRLLFYIRNGRAIFYILGTHDQVYRDK